MLYFVCLFKNTNLEVPEKYLPSNCSTLSIHLLLWKRTSSGPNKPHLQQIWNHPKKTCWKQNGNTTNTLTHVVLLPWFSINLSGSRSSPGGNRWNSWFHVMDKANKGWPRGCEDLYNYGLILQGNLRIWSWMAISYLHIMNSIFAFVISEPRLLVSTLMKRGKHGKPSSWLHSHYHIDRVLFVYVCLLQLFVSVCFWHDDDKVNPEHLITAVLNIS